MTSSLIGRTVTWEDHFAPKTREHRGEVVAVALNDEGWLLLVLEGGALVSVEINEVIVLERDDRRPLALGMRPDPGSF